MPPGSREDFLAAVHADLPLQQALVHPESMQCAVRIARAAGWDVGAADLLATSDGAVQGRAGERPPVEGEAIDFDGDGVPDAIARGGRWVMRDAED